MTDRDDRWFDVDLNNDDRYVHWQTPNAELRDEHGDVHRFVTSDAFMDVQQQRDEYRRTLALINATLCGAPRDETDARLQQVFKLLRAAGFDLNDAKAMRGLIASVAHE